MKFLLKIMLLLSFINLNAQVDLEKKSFTYGEFKAGYAISQFGKNLKETKNEGNYGASGGGLFTLGAFHKFERIHHFNFGGKFSALGATPSKGENGNEMFFNWWGAAISSKYYPFNKNADGGFNVYADYYFITQFTQKYRNVDAKQYNHQFAIGNGITLGSAYDFKYKKTNLVASLEYGFASRNGEVQNVGSVNFKSGYFGMQLGFKF